MLACLADRDPRIALCETGLVLGAGTRLAHPVGATDRLVVDQDRLEAHFAVAFQRPLSSYDLSAIEAAATHWQQGDRALANLRLVFADLPRLQEGEDALRLKAAELLFDAGLRADDLEKLLDGDTSGDDLEKYDPDQPRVPAGSGRNSGRWASLWSRFGAWLGEEVPVYDQDTGIQYGTQSRARAILTHPLTVGVAGTGALLGGDALLPAAAGASEAVTKNVLYSLVADDGQRVWEVRNGDNLETVLLALGGVTESGALLEGQMSTLHATRTAQQLMRWFLSALKRQSFVRIQGCWVGPSALSMLKAGSRLTQAEQAPVEADIKWSETQ